MISYYHAWITFALLTVCTNLDSEGNITVTDFFFFFFKQIKLLNVVTFFPGAKLFGKCNMNPLIALAALEMSFYLQWINSLPNVYPNCTSDILLLLRIFIKCYSKNGVGTTWLFFFSTSNKRKGGGMGNIACREQFRVSGNDLTHGSHMSTDDTDTYFAVFFLNIYWKKPVWNYFCFTFGPNTYRSVMVRSLHHYWFFTSF